MPILPTTIAGSLPKPAWLAEPEVLWAPCRLAGDTPAGPMTIVDTLADEHYGDRVKLAFAFAEVLNAEARELAALGLDVLQFDEPAFNVYLDEVRDWGIEALHRAIEGVGCTTAVHI